MNSPLFSHLLKGIATLQYFLKIPQQADNQMLWLVFTLQPQLCYECLIVND